MYRGQIALGLGLAVNQALAMDRKNERGSLALFGVLMAVVFLTVGGISIELWNVLSQRRQLSAVADAAASAGASAVDPDAYRANGELIVIPELGRDRAAAAIAASNLEVSGANFQLQVTADLVSVQASGEVDLIILGIIGAEPIRLNVLAEASPFQGN